MTITRPILLLSLLCPLVSASPATSSLVGTDSDGDGFDVTVDCDDNDPTVYPGAIEVCDGIDQNCDGLIDENTPGCSFFWRDDDNDSWGAGAPICLCLPIAPYTATQGGDCDDNNPLIWPGALEFCGNGLDDDCSGMADDGLDSDGDGFRACSDCNDFNPNIYPGAPELCDGLDNNCDGQVDNSCERPSLCNGDAGNQAGCTDCPCTNDAPPGTIGGCRNSAGTSTRLDGTGDGSVSLPAMAVSDLRFSLTGAPPFAFCILNSGDALAPGNPINPCFGMDSGIQASGFDGLRCAIMNTRRHGGRSADAAGEVGATNSPWGGEGSPSVGIASAGAGFLTGQTRYFQAIHRDDVLLVCQRGLNTSQAVEVLFTP